MAKLGRPKAAVVITDVERTELVRLTKRANVNRLLAFRARLVLACADAADDRQPVTRNIRRDYQNVVRNPNCSIRG